MNSGLRLILAVILASLSGVAFADGLPIGLGYTYTTETVDIPENAADKQAGSFHFNAATHSFSLLDYSGILCSGFQNAHRQMEARNEALRNAQYDTSKKAGDTITYSYRVAEPVEGSACGVTMVRSASEEKADVGGSLPHGKSSGSAEISGWQAFGVVAWAIGERTTFKLNITADFRSITIKGLPVGPYAIPGDDKYDNDLIAMPVDLELDQIVNSPVGSFIVWGSLGHDPVFWLLKQIDSSKIPSDFWRFGAGVGYQTPVEGLQVRAGYKNTDEGFDGRQVKESGYTLGAYYQM